MKRFVKYWKCEDGMTLIDLLLGLAIGTFLMGILYGGMITGFKVYEKVGIEWKMRDEADLAITNILESLYTFKVDDIGENDPTNCPEGECITILNEDTIHIDSGTNFVATQSDVASKLAEDKIGKRIIKLEKTGVNKNKLVIYEQTGAEAPKEIMKTPDWLDFSQQSELTAQCTKRSQFIRNDEIYDKCESATITINLVVDNDPDGTKENDPNDDTDDNIFFNRLVLKSQFGF